MAIHTLQNDQNTTIPNIDKNMEDVKLSYLAHKNVKCWSVWKRVWQFLEKLNITLIKQFSKPNSGISPQRNENVYQIKTICKCSELSEIARTFWNDPNVYQQVPGIKKLFTHGIRAGA